jgi:ABC-2 type transport system permease protein
VRRALALFLHEWRQTLCSPSFLLLGTLFLLLQSFLFLLTLQEFQRAPQFCRPTLAWLRSFWIGALFLVPLLTMRCVSEERRSGTLDVLLTTSMGSFPILLCKFSAAWAHYLLLWCGALAIQFAAPSLAAVTFPFPFFTAAELVRVLAFLLLGGALQTATGVFLSTLCRPPILAASCSTLALLFLFFAPQLILRADWLRHFPNAQAQLLRLDCFSTLGEFSVGILDSRTLIFYGSSFLALLAAGSLFLRHS